jgi:hypothetical protein
VWERPLEHEVGPAEGAGWETGDDVSGGAFKGTSCDVWNREFAQRMRSSEACKIIRALSLTCICFVGTMAVRKCNLTARGLIGRAQRRLSFASVIVTKKLTVVQLVKILRTVTRRFITVFTTAFHWATS